MTWLSNTSIDQLGDGLIKNYTAAAGATNYPVDIERFVTQYLKLPIVYHSFAEDDTSKLGFISDGKTAIKIYEGKQKCSVVFEKGTIVIEKYLCRERELGRKRFTIAHEAAHYVADKSLAAAYYHSEFDKEQEYTTDDLKKFLNIREAQVDRLAGALLMPKFAVMEYLSEHNKENGITVYDGGFIPPEDTVFINTMASDMRVSISALKIRLFQLGLYVKKSMDEYLTEIGLGRI